MGEEEGDRGPWIAIGRIIGPALPPDAVTVGAVRIFPAALLGAQTIKRLPKAPFPTPRISFQEEGTDDVPDQTAVSPPTTIITSRWIFTIALDEGDLDEVEVKAEAELRKALSALNLKAKEPYIAEILRFEGESHGYNHSAWVSGHAVDEVEALVADDIELANDLLPKLSGSNTASAATQFIRRGVHLSHAATVLHELWPAALLNYFMAIERISEDVTKELRKEMEMQLSEKTSAVAAELRSQLRDEALSDEDAVELVREASKKFSRIRFFFADLKVERAGRELGIHPPLVEHAQAFSKFRNQYLGHPRTNIPPEESRRWIRDAMAFRLSNAFLRAYLQRSS